MTHDRAITLALNGLSLLAANPDWLSGFLEISGLSPGVLKERAGEPELLASMLDFLLADDEKTEWMCRELNVAPRDLHLARHVLGAGAR
jgi:hypothetical protein